MMKMADCHEDNIMHLEDDVAVDDVKRFVANDAEESRPVEEDDVDDTNASEEDALPKKSQHENEVPEMKIMITPKVTANSDIPSVQVKTELEYAPTEKCTIPSYSVAVSSFQEENCTVPGLPVPGLPIPSFLAPVSSFQEEICTVSGLPVLPTVSSVKVEEEASHVTSSAMNKTMVDCQEDIDNDVNGTGSWSFKVYHEAF